jgi:hypothetical protein
MSRPALQQRTRDQIKAMTKVDAPYAGMVRYFCEDISDLSVNRASYSYRKACIAVIRIARIAGT